MSTNSVDIKCEVTLDDVVAGSLYAFDHNPSMKRYQKVIRFIGFPIMVISILLGIFVLWLDAGLLWPLGSIAIAIGLLGTEYFIYSSYFSRKIYQGMIRRVFRKNNKGIGRHSYRFSMEGIRLTTDCSDTTISWSAIDDVVQTSSHIFVVIRLDMAGIVPRSAFIDDETFHHAARDIQVLFSEAR